MLAVIAISLLFGALGLLLGQASKRFKLEGDPLVEHIDALLPQMQCGQCGYPGCRPYAEAMARKDADINRCPPGGATGVKALAELLGVEVKPLDVQRGPQKPESVAVIDEERCIGCTLCIQACPVDAILGAPRFMHTVIASECTGCELCLPPCPVDCIAMVPVKATTHIGRPQEPGWTAS
jgi:electron transport complex protein RnfB